MTREQTIEAIKVMQAWVEGKQIEASAHRNPGWMAFPDSEPLWAWDDLDYRIKPEPLEIEVWAHPESGELQGAWTGVDPAGMKHLGFSKKKFIELME